MEVRTNNVPRPLMDSWELNPKEREQFDYLNWEELDEGIDSATFFRYKGELYDLSQFIRFTSDSDGWDGYLGISYSSAIVVKYAPIDDDTGIIVGYAYE